MGGRFKGTNGDDRFGLSEGVHQKVSMLGGDDIVYFTAAALDKHDVLDGGDGYDRAVLVNGGDILLSTYHFVGFEAIVLAGSGFFGLHLERAVPSGQTLSIFTGAGTGARSDAATVYVDGNHVDGSLIVHTGGGADEVFGGAGADVMDLGRGDDVMIGNGGSDRFMFTASMGDDWGSDLIVDFEPGVDKVTLISDAIDSFEDLQISASSEGVVLHTLIGAGDIRFAGLAIGDLQASDFIFEPLHRGPAAHALPISYADGTLV